MRLKDKVALVTGAGGGIGYQTALRLSQEGASIVAVETHEKG
ncbi:MAG: SDR family oxidoreductase, partial [Chloroflexi bacterium]|nr:SDR family oxidoreductase [Chloroflexota bacterium]